VDAMDQLDALIDEWGKQNAAEREREELYAESVRRYYERRREHNRRLWRTYHLERAECLERTAAEFAASHRAKAKALAHYQVKAPAYRDLVDDGRAAV
jgi:hypothetical protein